jgi:hypothetical protein
MPARKSFGRSSRRNSSIGRESKTVHFQVTDRGQMSRTVDSIANDDGRYVMVSRAREVDQIAIQMACHMEGGR